jgi:hypothetical protein
MVEDSISMCALKADFHALTDDEKFDLLETDTEEAMEALSKLVECEYDEVKDR